MSRLSRWRRDDEFALVTRGRFSLTGLLAAFLGVDVASALLTLWCV